MKCVSFIGLRTDTANREPLYVDLRRHAVGSARSRFGAVDVAEGGDIQTDHVSHLDELRDVDPNPIVEARSLPGIVLLAVPVERFLIRT